MCVLNVPIERPRMILSYSKVYIFDDVSSLFVRPKALAFLGKARELARGSLMYRQSVEIAS